MTYARYVVCGVFCLLCTSCTQYRIHVKVVPEDTYEVTLDDYSNFGTTDTSGEKDLAFKQNSLAPGPKISVSNKTGNGYVILGGSDRTESKHLDSISVVKGAGNEKICYVRFLVDPVLYNEKHAAKTGKPAPAPVKTDTMPEYLPNSVKDKEEIVEFPGNGGHVVYRGINDNPQYARKLARTGTACFFVGMGLNYATAFIPTRNSDTSVNAGGFVVSLLMGVASGPLQIAGTSYAVGGAKLAWELGTGTCDQSNEPFTLWGPYKAGWVFMALSGIASGIASIVSMGDQNTGAIISLVSLGLSIGHDVCWSIANIKACHMTGRIRDCLEEQKTPAHRMRLELEPYAVTKGMGLRCSLIL